MTFRPALRVTAPLPILFLSAFLVLAGCATQPAGPVGPISSGNPRVDPSAETNGDTVDLEDAADGEQDLGEDEAASSGPYTPPHMQGRELIRAGVMLPFSHPRSSVRDEAEGMLAAIELALFDHAGDNFVLLPKDTGGATSIAEQEAANLKAEGADYVLGPLFGANVRAAADALAPETFFGFGEPEQAAPVVAFSNDNRVAGNGAWLASMMPEEDVREIITYASLRGYDSFAFFGPDSTLGQRIELAMRRDVFGTAGTMVISTFYEAGSNSPSDEAALFAQTVKAALARGERVAVLIPERGNRLRRIAPLLAYHGVDTRQVKMLGIAGWNDARIWREPSLNGAWFPSPPVAEIDTFNTRYERQYGQKPSALAAIAYDATALSITLSSDGDLRADELTNADGFLGVNGLFRFREDGTVQRSLAIMEIDPGTEIGVREIRPVASRFEPEIG